MKIIYKLVQTKAAALLNRSGMCAFEKWVTRMGSSSGQFLKGAGFLGSLKFTWSMSLSSWSLQDGCELSYASNVTNTSKQLSTSVTKHLVTCARNQQVWGSDKKKQFAEHLCCTDQAEGVFTLQAHVPNSDLASKGTEECVTNFLLEKLQSCPV
jgi:hypothetical protein